MNLLNVTINNVRFQTALQELKMKNENNMKCTTEIYIVDRGCLFENIENNYKFEHVSFPDPVLGG